MKHEIEHVNSTRKVLRIEVPGADLRKAYEHTLKEIGRHASLPGFRKGKVPRQIIEQRFMDEIRQEVVEHLVPKAVMEALKASDLHPIADPHLTKRPEHSLFRKDAELSFEDLTLEVGVEVYPQVELRRYKDLPAERKEMKVSPEDVDKALATLRERAAALVPVEGRPARKGDYLSADITYERGGKPQKDYGVTLALDDELPHGFLEHLAGLKAEDSKTFDVTHPTEHPDETLAGKTMTYTVDVKAVREKKLPALDDAFASQVSDEVKDLAALRAKLEEDLKRHAEAAARKALVEQLLQALVKENPVDLPETFVERQMDSQVEDAARFLSMRGQNPREAKVDWAGLRESGREDARARVHAMLLLSAVAEKENLQVTDADVDAEFAKMAESLRAPVEEVRKHYRQDEDAIGTMKARLQREKAIDFLLQHARITGSKE